ncbi:unnamed protein product [Lactuca saligna]|uniref:Uncharacterized protein n=1 Tax=Lactuca saligna TaxID=75948 RepID=A0AA35ZDX2_LACSI|nr:unnamed protein product [Lactuca saligna]
MNTQSRIDDDSMLIGQAQVWRYLYGAFDALAIRSCIELHIADIISNHKRATLSDIATGIDSPSINVDGLERLMKFLVHRKVFDEEDAEGERVYSLNHCSKWLLCNTKMSLAPFVMMFTNPIMALPAYAVTRSVKEGGAAFKLAHEEELFDFLSHNSDINTIYNEGMESVTNIMIDAIISSYKNGFLELKGSLVDVGGGTGVAISEIVKAYPHLKGINFDLPHVISTAISYDGVTHVAGDMFEAIPPAETIFMKTILHSYSNDDCVKILKNCRKAVPKETGKVIMVEIVKDQKGDDPFKDIRVSFDLAMFTLVSSGRERTEGEWEKLFSDCGFCRYNIIKIPALFSVIEAFP